jgi:hypothetical protein
MKRTLCPDCEPRIVLYRGATAWMADFRHATAAAEIFDLFETYELPTPYQPMVDATTVAKGVAERNPGHRVIVRETTQ